jgi:hypothetical protein
MALPYAENETSPKCSKAARPTGAVNMRFETLTVLVFNVVDGPEGQRQDASLVCVFRGSLSRVYGRGRDLFHGVAPVPSASGAGEHAEYTTGAGHDVCSARGNRAAARA